MATITGLSEGQRAAITAYSVAGNYPAMYTYIAQQIASGGFQVPSATDSKTYYWYSQAGVVNVNDPNSPAAAFIRNVDLGGGNTQSFSGSFTRADGTGGDSGTAQLAGSLQLANNNFYREFTDDPALTTEAVNLPEMRGSGLVRDLRAAMSLGDGFIQAWGKTSAMETSVQTSHVPG